MKKSLYLALSIILFAVSCSDDSDSGQLRPGQLVDVCIGVKLANENLWAPNVMKVPYNPVPQEEWPALLKDNYSSDIHAIICRIQTDLGVFYHCNSMSDSSVGGYLFTEDGLRLYYTDSEWKTQQGTEIPEDFPCIEGWECIYYRWNNYRWNNN